MVCFLLTHSVPEPEMLRQSILRRQYNTSNAITATKKMSLNTGDHFVFMQLDLQISTLMVILYLYTHLFALLYLFQEVSNIA